MRVYETLINPHSGRWHGAPPLEAQASGWRVKGLGEILWRALTGTVETEAFGQFKPFSELLKCYM